MAKSDRRVQYTKRVLKEAVLELLEKKPIDDLTIKEICELADVNRGTFYLHYAQPRDILAEIENDFLQQNAAAFDQYWKQDRDTERIALIFRFVMENRRVCRLLMGDNGDPQFFRNLINNRLLKFNLCHLFTSL